MYYIYALIDLRSNLPFYIGKGRSANNRHLDHFKETIEHNSNRHKIFKMNYLCSIGLTIPVEILVNGIGDEGIAYDIEASYIRKYGRENIDPAGILVNILLDSRTPPSARGKKQTEEHKAKRIASRKQTLIERGLPPRTIESRKKQSENSIGEKNPFYGKTHSREFGIKQSAMMTGNQFNSQTYEFISPNGKKFEVVGFAKFCREHQLSASVLEKGMYYDKWAKKGKNVGWRVRKIV